jgi:hypothetical protein
MGVGGGVNARYYQGRLLLRPNEEMNEVVGGVLARAVQQSGGCVRLHAFTFASNHFHLLVWARGAALAGFMQYLCTNLSRKVGRLVDWSGGFWERRYSAEPVLDDEALVGRLRYVLAHGVKEGLVEKCTEWPGLTCLPQLLGPARRLFRWFKLRRGVGRASGVGGGAPAVLERTGRGGEAAGGTKPSGRDGSRGPRTGYDCVGGRGCASTAPAYAARTPQAQPAAIGACLHAPCVERAARAVPGLCRGVPRGGGAVEARGFLGALSSLLLPTVRCAGSCGSSSLTPPRCSRGDVPWCPGQRLGTEGDAPRLQPVMEAGSHLGRG